MDERRADEPPRVRRVQPRGFASLVRHQRQPLRRPLRPQGGLPPETPAEVVVDADGGTHRGGERLSNRTVSGGLWTIGTYFLLNVIRLAANLILTRLLVPQMFGTMALVSTVMAGIRLFSDVGIGPALISNPRGEEENFLRTAYTIQNMRGVLIWLAACMLAPLAARYFGAADANHAILIQLLPVAGFAAVIDGLRSTAIFRIQRALRFGPLSIIELTEMSITSIGMVLYARFIHANEWALLLPALFGTSVGMCMTHFLMRDRRDRWGIDLDCAADMMRIGKWIFLSTLIMFFASQFEKLIFGSLVDAETLGIYGIALGLAAIPLTAVLRIGGSVLFPTFSRVASHPARFRDVYGRTRTMLLTAGATIVCGMIACGPFIIGALYRENYAAAGWMLQLLAIGAWFQIVDASNVAALLAHQKPKLIALGNSTKVVFMLALVPLAYHLPIDNQTPGSKLAMAFIALGFSDMMRAIVSTAAVRSIVATDRKLILPDLTFPFIIAAVGIGALVVARAIFPHVDDVAPVVETGSKLAAKLHRFTAYAKPATVAGFLVVIVWLPLCMLQWRRSRGGGEKPSPSFSAQPAQ